MGGIDNMNIEELEELKKDLDAEQRVNGWKKEMFWIRVKIQERLKKITNDQEDGGSSKIS
jgi:hypothetical protein